MPAPGHVYIVGGGLAGMTAAMGLADNQIPVTILEKSYRMGGKAGAVFRQDWSTAPDGVWEDHGYHVFPGWYRNVRQLLKDLGIYDHLIDIDKFYHLSRPARPSQPDQITDGDDTVKADLPTVQHLNPDYFTNRLHAFYPIKMTWPIGLWRNVRSGLLPFWQSVLSFYFMADLANEKFKEGVSAGYLDRISPCGYLRSRFYATNKIAALHQDTTLQASAIPNYEVSAGTIRNLGRYWLKTPIPMFSIMDGNLQERFIQPFQERLKSMGVEMRLNCSVDAINVEDAKLVGLDATVGGVQQRIGTPEDMFIISTPPEVTREFVPSMFDSAPALTQIAHLRSAPMAAMHIYFLDKLRDIPREHVTLFCSQYGTSFIDLSQNWRGNDPDKTVLSVISSNFEPLTLLCCDEHVALKILSELCWFVEPIDVALRNGRIDWDKTQMSVRPHTDAPLFLNTIGCWDFRPQARTGISNLFMAGDYCQTDADLTTMESAVSSGILAAGEILRNCNIRCDYKPKELETHGDLYHLLLKYIPLPLVKAISLFVPRDDDKRERAQSADAPTK